jgi:peptidoglycan/LPS O-acetylase OafA/YrhL
MAYLSKISYGFFLMQLYLWQITRKFFLVTGLPEINILKIIVSFLICLGGAIVLYEGIEKPIKQKFLQRENK